MINFKPTDADMASLPLEDVVYFKTYVISMSRKENYDFMGKLFRDDEVGDYINHFITTIAYDFVREENDDKFITIFEGTSSKPLQELSIYLQEILTEYTHEAIVFFIMFTHDGHCWQLTDEDGVVKFEELHDKQEA